jgi:carbamoyltransferase
VRKSRARFRPRHPVLGAAGSRVALPFAEWYFRRKQFHRSTSHFAAERQQELLARLARGETAYLAGISIGGYHNSGVALIEVRSDAGLRIICNNEEERFSDRKHANNYPSASLEALTDIMRSLGISPEPIVAWLGTYDYPLLVAMGIRCMLEEFPASMHLMFQDPSPTFDGNQFREGICAPVRLGQLFGLGGAVPIVGMAHHDNHAWFSYLVSPFARDPQPVMIAVIDGSGDFASISIYLGSNGTIRQIRSNGSVFDSLGMFYSVISSTQGGWTALSSEGRYMGAAAYGDMKSFD